MDSIPTHRHNLPMRSIFKTWWPLAASWLLMGAELPVLSAVVARLPNPEINLAAYGGVVFPLALIVESPIIMLLAASTALSKDWDSYVKLRRFMMTAGATLTGLHLLVAFTPLYYWVVGTVIGAPQEIIEPARIGLMIMTPWTWSIAYRRFNQGLLIRFDHSRAIGVGTVIRLSADGLILATGYWLGNISGIVVATSAVAAGVISEAIYVGFVKQPVLQKELKFAKPVAQTLTLRSFMDFYIPLAMTSLLTLLANPIGSAALSRMPDALPSLAVWPVVTGLVFMLRGLGVAFNEVVVALLDQPGSSKNLRRFTILLSTITTIALLILAATPLSEFWFVQVSALHPDLAELAQISIWIALPLPALSVLQSWYQGAILHGRQTRGITESVIIYLATSGVVLGFGVLWGQLTGLYIGIAALGLSVFTQTTWLWFRSQPVMHKVTSRDAKLVGQPYEAGAVYSSGASVTDFLFQGLALGLAAAFSPGPFQAFLISQAVAKGWKRAAPIAFAPLISDGPIIFVILLVLDQLPTNFLRILGVFGGLFVFYLAWGLWQQWRKGTPIEAESFEQNVSMGGNLEILLKGVLMNLLSPGPYTFWTLVTGPILLAALRQSSLHGVSFLFGFYGTLIGGMLGIAILFHLARRLGPGVVRGLTLASILILITFGGLLLQRGIWG